MVTSGANTPEKLEYIKTLPLLQCHDVADAVVYALSTPENVLVRIPIQSRRVCWDAGYRLDA